MPRNFHDFVAQYLEFTAGHEATPKIHKWSIISILAAALERRVWLDRGYYTLYPNLYTFIIGRSGLIKKSTSTAIAVNLLREIPDVRIMSERLTASSLIEQLRLSGKTFEYGEEKIRHSPLFAYASELSVFLEEVWGNVTTLLTTFYDCQPNDPTKAWTYNTIGRGETKIYGPALNILGASTKAWLKKCIPATEMEGGFTSRILFVVENSGPEHLVPWPAINDELVLMRLRLIEDLNQIYSLTGPFGVSEGARKLFSDWYRFHTREVIPLNSDPKMAGYMGRKGDLVLKLAMVRCVSLTNELILSKDHIDWAGRELEALEPDMRNAFGFGGDQGELTFELRNYLKNRVKVPKAEILKVFGITAPANEIQISLKDLIDMDEIEEVTEGEITSYAFLGSDISLLERRKPQQDTNQ